MIPTDETQAGRGVRFAILALAVMLLCSAAPIQQDDAVTDAVTVAPTESEEPTGPDRATLESRIAALEPAEGEDPSPELEDLKKALSWLQQADQEKEQSARFGQLADGAPAQLEQTRADLAAPLPEPEIDVPDDATVDDVAERLSEARSTLDDARKAQQAVEDRSDTWTERRTAVTDETASSDARLAEIKTELAAPPSDDLDAAVREARRTALGAERAFLGAKLERLEKEIRSYDVRRDLIRAQRQQAERDVLVAQRLVDMWDQVVTERRAAAAEAASTAAAQAALDAADEHEVVQEIIRANAELTEQLAQAAAHNQELANQKQEIEEDLALWKRVQERDELLVAQVGLIEAVGQRLRSERLQLPDANVLGRRKKSLQNEMRTVQVLLNELEDQLLTLVDPAREATSRLDLSKTPVPEDERDTIHEAARAHLAEQSQLVSELIGANEVLFEDTILQLQQEHERLIELTDRVRTFIDERVLWIQSNRPLAIHDFTRAWSSIKYFFGPAQLREAANATWQGARSAPILSVVIALVCGALLVLQPRHRKRLDEVGTEVLRRGDQMSLTWTALLLSALIALPWPLLAWGISWRMGASPEPSDYTFAFANALGRIGLLAFAMNILFVLSRPNGLGEAHFRWRPHNLALLRRHLRWLVPVSLPIIFVSIITYDHPDEIHRDSLGRLTAMADLAAFAVFTAIIFHPTRGILHGTLTQHRGGWLDRLRWGWYPFLVSLPLALATAAAFGYVYTSMRLGRLAGNTYLFILFALITYHVLLRWLYSAQRKLVIEQAKKRRAALAEAAERAREDEAAEGVADAAVPVEQELEDIAVDFDVINKQTRRLLRSAAQVGTVIAVFLIWADVVPALGILDEVPLWSSTRPMSAAMTAADGTILQQTIDQIVPVTLQDLAMALLILVLTWAVSRNIRGLLEITVLQRLPITAGARYATSTVVQYAVAIIGVVVAFHTIEVRWSSVQWLAAAITVGLGFGLQEIVANFVSGLIILFERPIRVGDIVTVGGVSGTVTRIQMRATTVCDWDRKELIIPNKAFIVGQIVNWSLTDTILRVKVPVKIVHGSNTELARKLLLDAAKANERVLEEPEPSSLFLGIGEHALEFELRVYIPNISHSMAVRHELNNAIERSFREAGIEFAFPQQDVHIKMEPESRSRVSEAGFPTKS